jgi:hypothetical protein
LSVPPLYPKAEKERNRHHCLFCRSGETPLSPGRRARRAGTPSRAILWRIVHTHHPQEDRFKEDRSSLVIIGALALITFVLVTGVLSAAQKKAPVIIAARALEASTKLSLDRTQCGMGVSLKLCIA